MYYLYCPGHLEEIFYLHWQQFQYLLAYNKQLFYCPLDFMITIAVVMTETHSFTLEQEKAQVKTAQKLSHETLKWST